jgi:hypothetical protein
MSNDEILNGNKMIAEFMEEIVLPIEKNDLYPVIKGEFGLKQTRYHCEWNWLMPAVEKIKDIDNEADIEMAKMLEFFKDDEECNIFHTSIFCHLKEVWNRTVVFIKWYNAKC